MGTKKTWTAGVLALAAAAIATAAGPDEVAASAAEVNPLLVGAEVPAAQVRRPDGEAVSLRELVDGKPTILLFYRGGWCPYCTAQLSQLQEVKDEILGLGYQILAFSPDKPANIAAATKAGVSEVPLYSDADMEAARAFGISYRVDDGMFAKLKGYGIDLIGASGRNHRQLPVPAVFVAGADSKLTFTYVNPDYSQRLAPEVLLAVAKTGGARNPRKAKQ